MAGLSGTKNWQLLVIEAVRNALEKAIATKLMFARFNENEFCGVFPHFNVDGVVVVVVVVVVAVAAIVVAVAVVVAVVVEIFQADQTVHSTVCGTSIGTFIHHASRNGDLARLHDASLLLLIRECCAFE